MNWWQKSRLAFRALFRKENLDTEMGEEMRLHIEMQMRENIAAGMKPAEAQRTALREFGWVESIKETCREQRGIGWIENLFRDLHLGARLLRKNPGVTAVAVFTLALGIGATSSVFNLIQGVLLTPPPYPKPQEIILIQSARMDGQPYVRGPSTEQWTEWQKESKSVAAMTGYDWTFDYLILPKGSVAVTGLEVTKEYFRVLGINPLLGRTFLDSETPNNPQNATFIILGYDLWQRRFNGQTNIIGTTLHLSRHEPFTVVGVMPPNIRFLPSFGEENNPSYDLNARVDYWLPVAPDPSKPQWGSGNGPWSVAARLRPGKTIAQAQAELVAIAARQAQSNEQYQALTVKVQPLTQFLNRDGARLLFPLLGAVVLVFLIACGNVATLLLGRGLQRQQEYSLRCALGAHRVQIFRQVITETMLLAASSGAVGLPIGAGISKVFKVTAGVAIPRLDSVKMGWPVLACCFLFAIVSAVLAGLLPAFRASQLDPGQVIKGSGLTFSKGRTERSLLSGVIVVEAALTLVLLVGAGLLIRTVVNLALVHPGFETRRILTMSVMTDYSQKTQDNFHERALERISSLPGVESAAFVLGLPLTGTKWVNDEMKVEGQPDRKPSDTPVVSMFSVTPDYFKTLGLKLLAGRNFRSTDSAAGWKLAPEPAAGETPCVCIINQAMADEFFPNENPIGKRLITWPWPKRPKEVIGITANAHTQELTRKAEPEVYLPFWQFYVFTKHLVVRTASDPRLLSAQVQRELRAVDPTVGIGQVETMQQIRSESVATQTLVMRLLLGFSISASVLALVGIYGVVSLAVNSRKRELAIRMAVGAQKQTVVSLVLSGGLKLIVLGVVIGIAMASMLVRLLRTFLFGIEPTDPMTFTIVAILFAGAALLACLLPAFRATRVHPMTALRYE